MCDCWAARFISFECWDLSDLKISGCYACDVFTHLAWHMTLDEFSYYFTLACSVSSRMSCYPMASTLKRDACVWSVAAWTGFCLLDVRLFHYIPSIIQWCKHPLSITVCQMPFTKRANGRKRDRRKGRTNAPGREKTEDNQRERRMKWGSERLWVRMKYSDWDVDGDSASILLSQWERICLGWTGYREVHLDRLIPNTRYNIFFPVLCATGLFLQRFPLSTTRASPRDSARDYQYQLLMCRRTLQVGHPSYQ